MGENVFDTSKINEAEISKINKEEIELYVPIGQPVQGEEQHRWKSSLRINLPKEYAIKAGLSEEVFDLDEIHYEEYTGKKLSELLDLVEQKTTPNLEFNISFDG